MNLKLVLIFSVSMAFLLPSVEGWFWSWRSRSSRSSRRSSSRRIQPSPTQSPGTPSGGFTNNCMKCICEVEGCEMNIGTCNDDRGSDSCGPYQIKLAYYSDCGQPHGPYGSWRTCTKQMACSETCVRSYMNRYGQYCKDRPGNGGGPPRCLDYAKIHNAGPRGCGWTLSNYVSKMNACCRRKGGCD